MPAGKSNATHSAQPNSPTDTEHHPPLHQRATTGFVEDNGARLFEIRSTLSIFPPSLPLSLSLSLNNSTPNTHTHTRTHATLSSTQQFFLFLLLLFPTPLLPHSLSYQIQAPPGLLGKFPTGGVDEAAMLSLLSQGLLLLLLLLLLLMRLLQRQATSTAILLITHPRRRKNESPKKNWSGEEERRQELRKAWKAGKSKEVREN